MTHSLLCRGAWSPIDRHAKLRKVVQVRLHDVAADALCLALARWDRETQSWLDINTGQPISFTPTEYLRT